MPSIEKWKISNLCKHGKRYTGENVNIQNLFFTEGSISIFSINRYDNMTHWYYTLKFYDLKDCFNNLNASFG